jgi:hypothetical protein
VGAVTRPVRELGRVTDFDGRPVPVGVDYNLVVIGDARLDRAQRTELYRLLFDASTAAGQWERQEHEEREHERPESAELHHDDRRGQERG